MFSFWEGLYNGRSVNGGVFRKRAVGHWFKPSSYHFVSLSKTLATGSKSQNLAFQTVHWKHISSLKRFFSDNR